MFRRTDSQATFGSLSVLLSPEKIAKLEKKHWAGGFRHKALPVLLANEETFRPLFCEDNGRPNKPVAETCDPENEIEVVTHVSVEGAHESDQHATIPVLDDLESKGCKPETLLADTNYGSGQNIVDAAKRGVDLVSPSCGCKPKAEEGGFILDDFMFSSDGQRIEHCPMGQEPVEQGACGKGRRYARMDAKRCERCSWAGHCPARRSDRATTVTLTWLPSAGATSARRHRERSKEFKDGYRLRSGIEATNSEYKRPYGGGRLRVRGSPAVHRTVKFKFMALNIRRWIKPARKTQNQAA
jgi:hypothetical protein